MMKKSTTLFWMTVLVVTATTFGKIPDDERGVAKKSRHREHDDKVQEAEKLESERSEDDKTFEDLKAELQGYLDLEKESDEGLGDDIEMMGKDGDDDAENDDVEDDNEGKNEGKAVEKEDEIKGKESDNAEDNDVGKNEDVKGQRLIRRYHHSWTNCNYWKKAYYREQKSKKQYYKLYLSYLRKYRKYYNKYKAYLRCYRSCKRDKNTCKRKFHRLRQGYKNIVKSHTHLLRSCHYRG